MLKKSSIALVGVLLVVFATLSTAAAQQNFSTYVIQQAVIIQAGESKIVGAGCTNADDYAISGGYQIGQGLLLEQYGPDAAKDARGWRFKFLNTRTTAVNAGYSVLCLAIRK